MDWDASILLNEDGFKDLTYRSAAAKVGDGDPPTVPCE
jgi:hypothetical protein